MSIGTVINDLNKFIDIMEFNRSATDTEIEEFQSINNIKLPDSYIELLKCFDGGEIFVPGIVIYGINAGVNKHTVKYINGKNVRKDFNIPSTLLIIGKLNYGDWLCIDLNQKNEIVQWDHEQNEEFCRWESLEDWLEETINEYIKYEGGAQS